MKCIRQECERETVIGICKQHQDERLAFGLEPYYDRKVSRHLPALLAALQMSTFEINIEGCKRMSSVIQRGD